jgi:uncharacterized membrane protein HdeD (DUF308 family)
MRLFWSQEGQSGLWLGPALLGLVLIALGVLLYAMPQLLSYFIAGLFILGGCGLIGSAWRMRRRVTYRPIDQEWHVRQPPDDPGGL